MNSLSPEARRLREGLRQLKAEILCAREQGRWRKSRFNLFQVFGKVRQEHAHSSVLAWLLDPEEAHGLGDEVLRRMWRSATGRELPSSLVVSVETERREQRNIFDVVVEIVCRSEPCRWLVIENKIESPEGEGQTVRYAEHWRRREGTLGKNIILIFLSREAQPRSRDFVSMSYGRLRQLLDGLQPAGEAELVIRHFRKHIQVHLEGRV